MPTCRFERARPIVRASAGAGRGDRDRRRRPARRACCGIRQQRRRAPSIAVSAALRTRGAPESSDCFRIARDRFKRAFHRRLRRYAAAVATRTRGAPAARHDRQPARLQ
ncbi:hypothetical protein DB771_01575 [Burkholderia sp. AU29985]|nr:hypothetical protein BDSB_16355 [Burkholderia dolosa PC543]PUA78584.1 hypothetical protein DB771_01575 [Burkholderia sp. AU29985]